MLKWVQDKCNDIHGEWKGIDYVAGKIMCGFVLIWQLLFIGIAASVNNLKQMMTQIGDIGYEGLGVLILILCYLIVAGNAIWTEQRRKTILEAERKEIELERGKIALERKEMVKHISELLDRTKLDNRKALLSLEYTVDLIESAAKYGSIEVNDSSDGVKGIRHLKELSCDGRLTEKDQHIIDNLKTLLGCVEPDVNHVFYGKPITRYRITESYRKLAGKKFTILVKDLKVAIKDLKVDVNTIILI